MSDITLVAPVDLDAELDRLAQRYSRAGSGAVDLLNVIGGRAEGLLDRLPQQARTGLQEATRKALEQAMNVAHGSRGVVPDQKGWLNTVVGTAMGAAGGAGGLPAALAELPVTTTLLLRIIQGVAVEYGFDPASDNVQFDCIEVFAAAGPLSHDDGADLGFLSARMTLTGSAVQTIIARVAPRLATVLGQKLAAQAVPVLGAVAGAATNYAYTSYYQEMAHVHFGLRKLAIEADVPVEELVARLRSRIASRAVT
ncbi:EcsC family protein [uncultured Roseobacter sp.]|uniref:EcsC family protein n=1 Tax=uncultured Roseobacter sp. TaxID=114847 RepID=UPI0026392B3E|nr:EcsC family protein [uncultured Roseobacter sp.]